MVVSLALIAFLSVQFQRGCCAGALRSCRLICTRFASTRVHGLTRSDWCTAGQRGATTKEAARLPVGNWFRAERHAESL